MKLLKQGVSNRPHSAGAISPVMNSLKSLSLSDDNTLSPISPGQSPSPNQISNEESTPSTSSDKPANKPNALLQVISDMEHEEK